MFHSKHNQQAYKVQEMLIQCDTQQVNGKALLTECCVRGPICDMCCCCCPLWGYIAQQVITWHLYGRLHTNDRSINRTYMEIYTSPRHLQPRAVLVSLVRSNALLVSLALTVEYKPLLVAQMRICRAPTIQLLTGFQGWNVFKTGHMILKKWCLKIELTLYKCVASWEINKYV